MPEMDGFEATKQIRAMQARKQPVIVALTASALAHERELCKNVGMDHFLTKPVRPQDLQRILLSEAPLRPAEPMDEEERQEC